MPLNSNLGDVHIVGDFGVGVTGSVRKVQHRNVINAAKDAGVGLIAYTSILHADTSPLFLAEEHRDTEAALAEAGVPFVLLRNGWYTEVYTWRLPLALKHGVLMGAAGDDASPPQRVPTMPGLRRLYWPAAAALVASMSWRAMHPSRWPSSSPWWPKRRASRLPARI